MSIDPLNAQRQPVYEARHGQHNLFSLHSQISSPTLPTLSIISMSRTPGDPFGGAATQNPFGALLNMDPRSVSQSRYHTEPLPQPHDFHYDFYTQPFSGDAIQGWQWHLDRAPQGARIDRARQDSRIDKAPRGGRNDRSMNPFGLLTHMGRGETPQYHTFDTYGTRAPPGGPTGHGDPRSSFSSYNVGNHRQGIDQRLNPHVESMQEQFDRLGRDTQSGVDRRGYWASDGRSGYGR